MPLGAELYTRVSDRTEAGGILTMRTRNHFLQSALIAFSCFSILSAVCSAQQASPPASTVSSDSPLPPSRQDGVRKPSPEAQQMARIIGVDSDLARLSELTAAATSNPTPASSLEQLLLHQRITEGVMIASLDVDSTLEQVDYERAQISELRSILRARRDRALGSTNLAVLAAGTGLGIVGGLLQFSKITSDAGNAITFASGGISTAFSLRGFRQVRGGKRPGWVLPNMLAPFLGQPQGQQCHYPDDVWAFLTNPLPGQDLPANRKQSLVDSWMEAHRLEPLDSPQSARQISLMTSTNASDKGLSMDLLNQRAAMLADVSSQVAQMKQSLAEILRNLKR